MNNILSTNDKGRAKKEWKAIPDVFLMKTMADLLAQRLMV